MIYNRPQRRPYARSIGQFVEAIAYLLAGGADALVAATGRVLDELPD